MDNIKNWFKQGTSEKEKKAIESISNLESNDDTLDYEMRMHYVTKDLISALDAEDLETASKLFPQVNDFLLKEDKMREEKKQELLNQIEVTQQNLLDKKITGKKALIETASIRRAKEQNDKRFAYLKPLSTDITEKLEALRNKLKGQ